MTSRAAMHVTLTERAKVLNWHSHLHNDPSVGHGEWSVTACEY
jgi:hypothetical protein